VSKPLLTPRQRQCLDLVRRGMTSPQIAKEIDLSRRTVDQYIDEAAKRLGARTRPQAVAEAVQRGEI
jgi:DNA-binding CsgD family transcriptional regulator